MPCNLFGPNDNYDLNNSHFLPAIIRKIYIASKKKNKIVNLWGTGKPLREVLYVDEVAYASEYFLKKNISHEIINIGSSTEMSIREYAKKIRNLIDPNVIIKFNNNKNLDGVKRKKLDILLARKYGWSEKMGFYTALNKTIEDFKKRFKF